MPKIKGRLSEIFYTDPEFGIREANRRLAAIESFAKGLKAQGKLSNIKKGYTKRLSPAYTGALNSIAQFTGSKLKRRFIPLSEIPYAKREAYLRHVRHYLRQETSTPAGIVEVEKRTREGFSDWAYSQGFKTDDYMELNKVFATDAFQKLKELYPSSYVADYVLDMDNAGFSAKSMEDVLNVGVKQAKQGDARNFERFMEEVLDSEGVPEELDETLKEWGVNR